MRPRPPEVPPGSFPRKFPRPGSFLALEVPPPPETPKPPGSLSKVSRKSSRKPPRNHSEIKLESSPQSTAGDISGASGGRFREHSGGRSGGTSGGNFRGAVWGLKYFHEHPEERKRERGGGDEKVKD